MSLASQRADAKNGSARNAVDGWQFRDALGQNCAWDGQAGWPDNTEIHHPEEAQMTRLQILRSYSSAARLTAVFVVASTLASAGLAADAFISGPSIARANTPVLLSGGNFAPNTAVTVMVRSPNGQEAGYGAVVNADGTLLGRWGTAPSRSPPCWVRSCHHSARPAYWLAQSMAR